VNESTGATEVGFAFDIAQLDVTVGIIDLEVGSCIFDN
jgi:hypothetical protein